MTTLFPAASDAPLGSVTREQVFEFLATCERRYRETRDMPPLMTVSLVTYAEPDAAEGTLGFTVQMIPPIDRFDGEEALLDHYTRCLEWRNPHVVEGLKLNEGFVGVLLCGMVTAGGDIHAGVLLKPSDKDRPISFVLMMRPNGERFQVFKFADADGVEGSLLTLYGEPRDNSDTPITAALHHFAVAASDRVH